MLFVARILREGDKTPSYGVFRHYLTWVTDISYEYKSNKPPLDKVKVLLGIAKDIKQSIVSSRQLRVYAAEYVVLLEKCLADMAKREQNNNG